jgi:hypothetical protein
VSGPGCALGRPAAGRATVAAGQVVKKGVGIVMTTGSRRACVTVLRPDAAPIALIAAGTPPETDREPLSSERASRATYEEH